ncbi:MAG TPA: hypothetical protein PKC91_01405 [Ignavibacteria bacterium]|nr:hypothetical protein [Ignavibacteria bacterium]
MRFKFLSLIILLLLLQNVSYSQLFPRFSIAGGPTVGWFWNNTDDLNNQLQSLGIPGISKDGFLTLGGGGFVDLPLKNIRWLRVGGSGEGFTTETQIVSPDFPYITRTVNYHYGSGGITLDYVKTFGKSIELTLGAYVSTGKLTIQLYQNDASFGSWNNIFGQYGGDSSTQNFSNKLSVRFYAARPQIGLGVFLTGFLYAKLNAGYQFSTNNDWYVDDDRVVLNAPSGIKADGFLVNFSLNVGLFTK